jgi:hypothetical protein
MFSAAYKFLVRLYFGTALFFIIALNLGRHIAIFNNYWITMLLTFLIACIVVVIIRKPVEFRIWSNRKTIGTVLMVIISAIAVVNLMYDLININSGI